MTREEAERIEKGEVLWLKEKPSNKISWKHSNEDNLVFRFDDEPEREYYLYRDYRSMAPDRKKVFDEENPFWADFFGE